ncbi:chemotaxis protein CheA [Falsihalocynthiibacter sp. SS001]|uniref:chemotaxis protein CheA n=1 Tax=Falsihalocynthiibacter sp. SS001 TaxID=3349698 RepID=UPI0036D4340D
MTDQHDPMAEIRTAFFQECEELLEALQDGLMAMQDGSSDQETINVVFRAVHSIKGGAGAFGLDDLVRFAHRYETTLDYVRAGTLTPAGVALKIFFRAADILSDIVRASRDGEPIENASVEEVLALLLDLTGDDPEEEEEIDPSEFVATGMGIALDIIDLPPLSAPENAPATQTALRELEVSNSTANETMRAFEILFKPQSGLYASGNEPVFIFRLLRNLGQISVEVDKSTLPDLEDLAAEESYLSWKITLITQESSAQIHEAFDFVIDFCSLEIQEVPLPQIQPSPDGPALDTSISQSEEQGSPVPPASPPQPLSTSDELPSATKTRATVRVDLERVDRLVNLVGELVINQAMLSQIVAETGLQRNTSVFTGLDELQQLTRDIQDSVMMIRAQPVKTLFQRMARIVRESSAAVGKEVHLKTVGEGTEVDKTVIERLADPLTHMIRNAVDHGLETTDNRIDAGKPSTGVISLSARHRSGRVVIEVSDDGGGINRSKVLSKAISKGLVAEDAQLSDSEIDNILFLPGFSTADQISNISGRGVGMDVVRSSIQALGGRVAISSAEGLGTTFSISLPLTLAVLDGMVVQVAGETLVVPLNTIEETLTLEPEAISSLDPNTSVVNVRNGFVPLLDLGAALGFQAPREDYAGSIVLLIAQENGSRAALIVDEIRDQRQVVIKGLQERYGRAPGIAAATILGDGQIALILDPVDIVASASSIATANENSIDLAG